MLVRIQPRAPPLVRKHFHEHATSGTGATVPWARVCGIVVGAGMVLVALFMLLPASANLPDSWVGAVIALVVGSVGVILIVASVRKHARKP